MKVQDAHDRTRGESEKIPATLKAIF